MSRVLRIVVLVGMVVLLIRAVREAREPGYESHVTGDAGARAGIALVEQGKHEEALPILERALAKPLLEVESADAFAALGDCYLKVEPGDGGPSSRPKGLVYVGIAHRLRGRFDEAREAFTRALELAPDHAEAHESLGAMELVGGRPAEAIPHLERARDLDGSKAITRSNLALSYAMVGRLREAEREVEQAARLGYPKIAALREQVAASRAAREARLGHGV
jgi:tetratricopeptide (TPR) repeat protein